MTEMNQAEQIDGIEIDRGMMRGTVVEDRWGLRWRADTRISTGENGWQCRSAGLRIFRSNEQLQERGPLKFIRLDQAFAGEEAKAARQAGEAEDAQVTVDGGAAEDAADRLADRAEREIHRRFGG